MGLTKLWRIHQGLATALICLVTIFSIFLEQPSWAGAPPAAANATADKSAMQSKISHPDWLIDAENITGGETDGPAAVEKLAAHPRSEMVAAVRSWLRQTSNPNTLSAAYHAIVVLKMNELKPELLEAAKHDNGWRVFHALNSLLIDSDFAQATVIYNERLSRTLPAAASMAIIDGLSQMKVALTPTLFRRLAMSPSYEVREASVENFLQNHVSLDLAEQVERMKLSTSLKPFQVRLMAYQFFESLPSTDKKNLEPGLNAAACSKEREPKVKTVCAHIFEKSTAGVKK